MLEQLNNKESRVKNKFIKNKSNVQWELENINKKQRDRKSNRTNIPGTKKLYLGERIRQQKYKEEPEKPGYE